MASPLARSAVDHTRVALLRSRVRARCGDLDSAVAELMPEWQRALGEGDTTNLLTLTRALLYPCVAGGHSRQAVGLGTRALHAFEGHDLDADEVQRVGATVVWARVESGDHKYARYQGETLLARARTSGGHTGRAAVLWNLAHVESTAGRHDWAIRYGESTLAVLGDRAGARDADFFRARHSMGWLLLRARRFGDALRYFQIARSSLVILGDPDELLCLDVHQSAAHLSRGELRDARRCAEGAVERMADEPRCDQAEAAIVLADIHMARRRRRSAVDLCRRAATLVADAPTGVRTAALWRGIGQRFLAQGESEEACRAFTRALADAGLRPSRAAVEDVAGGGRP
ncbi:tetratricopeptide repeat protein [Cellulomonas sp. NPDC089187]|uniref:tetratricopeptide repeat protein n=1 Tax=Cellulomonas sp. NPDC089187 TaxID=3154970 RepID=UPI00343680CF